MTAPHYADEQVTLYHGDCIDVLRADDYGYDWNLGYRESRAFPDNSVDAVVCDPPYGLEFMGKDWDAPWLQGVTGEGAGFNSMTLEDGSTRTLPSFTAGRTNPTCRNCGGTQRGQDRDSRKRCRCDFPNFPPTVDRLPSMLAFQQWCTAWASECLRILKPGGHLVAFGGSRTWHRLAAAIEDSGFEVRDSIAWLYGSGFPKSLDVAKAIDKASGYVGEVVGTESVDVGMQGGHMHTGRDRNVVTRDVRALSPRAEQWQGWGTALKPSFEPIVVARKPLSGTVAANVLEHGTGALNIDGCRVGTDSTQRVQRGTTTAWEGGAFSGEVPTGSESGRWPTNVALDEDQAAALDQQSGVLKSGANPTRRGSDKFRNAYGDFAGQSECVAHRGADEGGASRFFPVFRYEAKAPGSERPSADGVAHPTVKPLELMRWLVRLVTPPNGVVLDPFAGSGTTAEACIHEHMRCITVEREADYLPLITARLTKPMAVGFDFGAMS